MSQLMNQDAINYLFLKMAAHYNHLLPNNEVNLNFMKQEFLRELIDVKQELVFGNLKRHIRESKYPPTIADLVKEQPKEQRFNIPSVEETKRYLISLEEPSGNKISPEKKKLLDERLKAILSKDEMEW